MVKQIIITTTRKISNMSKLVIYKDKDKEISEENLAKIYDELRYKTIVYAFRTSPEDKFTIELKTSANTSKEVFVEVLSKDREVVFFETEFSSKEPYILDEDFTWWTNNKFESIKGSEATNKANFIYEFILSFVEDLDRKIEIINNLSDDDTYNLYISGNTILEKEKFIDRLIEKDGVYFSSLKVFEKKEIKTYVHQPHSSYSPQNQSNVYTPNYTPVSTYSPSMKKIIVDRILKVTMGKSFDCFKANKKVLVFRNHFMQQTDDYLKRTLEMYGIALIN